VDSESLFSICDFLAEQAFFVDVCPADRHYKGICGEYMMIREKTCNVGAALLMEMM
jgi:hypothetical protein